MLGLITLDFGNTNPHAGIFQKNQDNWQLIKVIPLNELAIYLDQLGMNAHNTSVVVSEVKPYPETIATLQEKGFLITYLKDYWRGKKFAGMPVNYAETLGEDRLIEAYYVYKKVKEPSLLIDAGTFVTMDVVTSEGFLGGYIIPGVSAYLSTYEKGQQLKDVKLEMNLSQKLPSETASAITDSYSAFALLAKKLISQHNITKIILTGGSESLWEGLVQEAPGVTLERKPELIHSALHLWFTTQIEPL